MWPEGREEWLEAKVEKLKKGEIIKDYYGEQSS